MKLVFTGAAQVVTCAGPGRARRGVEMADAAVRTDTSVAVSEGRIAAIGRYSDLSRDFGDATVIDCKGRVLTPGLVDSHTHALFGKPRFEEHEMRAAGVGYMEIARRGGGIHSSVRDVRTRSEDELHALTVERVRRLASYGTTTLEIKSGYGLTVESEMKMLRATARVAADVPVRIVPTWMGAHEVPLEMRETSTGRRDYLELLMGEMVSEVSRSGLARFADVFCEPGVFDPDETRAILAAAQRSGLGLKVHADELEPSGGAELAAEIGATSADHLAAISEAGIRAIAASETVATLLPGTMLFLGRGRQAPARALIDAGAAVALATDFNPGSSPAVNFPLMMTLAVSQLRMSAQEALIAATVNGAAAVGLASETGQIAPGYSADIALFEAEDYRELPYWYGDRRCRGSWVRGVACHPYEPGLG